MTTARPQPRSSPPSALADSDPRPRLFTSREYRAMKDSGIIAGGEPAELRVGDAIAPIAFPELLNPVSQLIPVRE